MFGFDRMQLEETSHQGVGYQKLVCMLVDLLSQRYEKVVGCSMRILGEFFGLVD